MRVNKIMRRKDYEDMGRCRETILKLFERKYIARR
jgi:hypothetical protein